MSTLKASNIQPLSDSDPLIVSTNATERLRIDTTGKFGIGTSTPGSALEIKNFVSSTTTQGITGTVANAGILLDVDFQAPTATQYSSGLFWRDSALNTLPLAGIWVGDESSNGSSLHFGTSTTYANGITKIGLSIRNGSVGIGTTGPQSTLDVNGTLKVGDFGDTTNVMPKPTMSSGVGQVVPLMCYGGSTPTTLLSSGTWFVFFTGYMNGAGSNSSGAVDENPVVSGAFTVTLTSGQFLGLQVTHDASSAARSTTANLDQSGVIYRIFTDATLQNTAVPVNNSTHTPATGWTEFTETSSSPFKAKRYAWASGGGSSPALSDGASVVYMTSSSIGWVTGLNGYAIRIA